MKKAKRMMSKGRVNTVKKLMKAKKKFLFKVMVD